MGYKTITAYDGETWASLAQRGYGDVTKIPDVMRDNPNIPARPTIAGGTIIRLTVIDREDTATNFANLPPWKRPTL